MSDALSAGGRERQPSEYCFGDGTTAWRRKSVNPIRGGFQPGRRVAGEDRRGRLRNSDRDLASSVRTQPGFALLLPGPEKCGDQPLRLVHLVRISVDRYPGNPERSNQLYRGDPLTWEELGLTASIGDEPIGWRVQHDRDAFKEVWLTFENEDGRYPLYPGETAWMEYSYTVSDTKWGTWFQRAIRLPTRRLSVTLDFPAELDPAVWGTETTMTASAFPFRAAIQQSTNGDRRIYAWSTDDPPLHARYRLEWKFRARHDHDEKTGTPMATASASETMRSLGIVQDGDSILRGASRPFDLPSEAEDARRVVAELNSTAERVSAAHKFAKGMGVAAPQIGIDRAAAIVRPPGEEPITLLNPRIIDEAADQDEQYEGCLSFFDVRCMVPPPPIAPRRIDQPVAHQNPVHRHPRGRRIEPALTRQHERDAPRTPPGSPRRSSHTTASTSAGA